MGNISLRRLLAASFIAALIGSSLGTVLLAADELFGHPLRSLIGVPEHYPPTTISDILITALGIWMLSLIGTIPGSAVVGVPAIYYLRDQVASRPLLFAVPIVIYAVLLGMIFFGWLVAPTAYGARHFEVIWFYSAGCGIGFVAVLGWKSRA
jgi:di/tricarboxylate transporter